jgi:hypothetical protein
MLNSTLLWDSYPTFPLKTFFSFKKTFIHQKIQTHLDEESGMISIGSERKKKRAFLILF